MARDRKTPCIHYVCAHENCKRHFKDVTMDKCATCQKYHPRKVSKKPESVKSRREKDKDRHDNWKDSRNW